jgi:hypothetical protein
MAGIACVIRNHERLLIEKVIRMNLARFPNVYICAKRARSLAANHSETMIGMSYGA